MDREGRVDASAVLGLALQPTASCQLCVGSTSHLIWTTSEHECCVRSVLRADGMLAMVAADT